MEVVLKVARFRRMILRSLLDDLRKARRQKFEIYALVTSPNGNDPILQRNSARAREKHPTQPSAGRAFMKSTFGGLGARLRFQGLNAGAE